MQQCIMVTLFLLVLVATFDVSHGVSYEEMDSFFRNITAGKNINIRPVRDQNTQVEVLLFFHLIYIQEFDEVDGKLGLTGYFGLGWKDETISWDAQALDINSLTFTEEVLWRPNFIIGNSYGGVKYIFKDDMVKRVNSEGFVTWSPGDTFEVVCNADVSRYPFDTQICVVQVLPWGYTKNEIRFTPMFNYIITDWYNPSKTWEIVETRVDKSNEDLQLVEFYIKLKRHPMFFVLNLILPICVMSILNIFVFFLPAESGERVGFSVTVLLAIAVFLTISSDSLPATSEPRVPTISLLLFTDVVLSALIVILVIWSLRYYHRDDQLSVPSITRGFVRVSRFLRCKTCCRKNPEKRNFYTWDTDITWTDVGIEIDFIGGLFISLVVITVNVLYIVDVTVGLPFF